MNYFDFAEYQKQKNLVIFNKSDIENIFNLSSNSAKALINRYIKKGHFIALKRGLYCSKDIIPSKFSIANNLYGPSYISLNTALSYYGIIPEIVYEVTSITTKTTRDFTVQNISYKYRSIKKKAFTGYLKEKNYLIAYPEKALADYFYFVALKKIELNDRLNLTRINSERLKEYLALFESDKLSTWFEDNYGRLSGNSKFIN